jgi:hypothetical protein
LESGFEITFQFSVGLGSLFRETPIITPKKQSIQPGEAFEAGVKGPEAAGQGPGPVGLSTLALGGRRPVVPNHGLQGPEAAISKNDRPFHPWFEDTASKPDLKLSNTKLRRGVTAIHFCANNLYHQYSIAF